VSAAARPRGASVRASPPCSSAGGSRRPGDQAPGGAAPRTARAHGNARPLGRRPVAQAIATLNHFVVVIVPPLSTAAAARKGDAHIQTSRSILGSLPAAAQLVTRRYRALTYVRTRQAWTKPEVRWSTARHDSAVLIFDELEYEPFTENRRVPSDEFKIARPRPPATLSLRQTTRDLW
jgi:hypothetical protein